MTNRERYAEKILDIAVTGNSIAIDKCGNLHKCNELRCDNCTFGDLGNCRSCHEKVKEWSEQEYVKPPVDWSKVPVDTKVFVRDSDGGFWCPRYFARFENGKIVTWKYGATSFSAEGFDDVTWWRQGKLAEDTV